MTRLVAVLAWLLCALVAHAAEPVKPWPDATRHSRPWTRWWWPGSAVEPAQLTAQLEMLARAGIGGVEITPIYGARGAESKYIEFLSPRWVAMLDHTLREARRLDLGVDMATGTGWPFGGPWVPRENASSSLALVDGELTGRPTDMKVKRAAPGGEGLVLDPYSTAALDAYLEKFTPVLEHVRGGDLRAQFHDSFEYYDASWSPALPAKFREMHGYDIQDHAAELAGARPMDADALGRLKGDYRRTLAALHLAYVQRWVDWSHGLGFAARNQAHGAPGGLLDLYAASDFPETESFGATQLSIRGLRQEAGDIREDPDPPIGLIARFASSAAHLKPESLASSETLTWLRENFHESPQAAKPQLDRLFTAGINHILYHGTTYSPAGAAWPGWFFYAATQLNPTNPLWRDFEAMHAYVGRVQSVLQEGEPDNDVLFYWPEADQQDDAAGLMRQLGMHENQWLKDAPAGRLAQQLIAAGFSFDFISDAQIARLTTREGKLLPMFRQYELIVVPATRRMPVETLRQLEALQAKGARVFFESLPEDVPGLGRLDERRAKLAGLIRRASLRDAVHPDVAEALRKAGVSREGAADLGLWFTRRHWRGGYNYFLFNATGGDVRDWMALGKRAAQAWWQDPLTGTWGAAAIRQEATGTWVYVNLESGRTLILRTFDEAPTSRAPPWNYSGPSAGEPLALEGPWHLEFLRGGPELPAAVTLDKLQDWTLLDDPHAARFSGTARYRLKFDAPAMRADAWRLDLGELRETARVTFNGKLLGTVWSLPTTIDLAAPLEKRGNVLEIEVTNLPANRVRDLDRRKVGWKIMNDINIASLRYRALDASEWEPAPSGLLGPVRLVPLTQVNPRAP
jgi:hypothetical protein